MVDPNVGRESSETKATKRGTDNITSRTLQVLSHEPRKKFLRFNCIQNLTHFVCRDPNVGLAQRVAEPPRV